MKSLTLDHRTAGIINVWHAGQVLLPKVRRWMKNTDGNGAGRRQDVLQHLYSIQVVGRIMQNRLAPHLDRTGRKVDWDLVLGCLLLHDHGEGELFGIRNGGHDLHETQKNVNTDAEELNAFVERFTRLDDELSFDLIRAFTLQFARNGSNLEQHIDPRYSICIEGHKSHHLLEALLFEAIERYDYVLYALEQLEYRRKVKLAVKVLRRQFDHLNRLADAIPGFREEFWTSELTAFCNSLLERHKHRWQN